MGTFELGEGHSAGNWWGGISEPQDSLARSELRGCQFGPPSVLVAYFSGSEVNSLGPDTCMTAKQRTFARR